MGSDTTFEWSQALSVDDTVLDHEHQGLIKMMSDIKEDNARSLNKKVLLTKFDRLIELTQKHFSDEEEHMRKMNYPELEQHQRIHQQLFESMEKYRQEFIQSVYGRFPSAVFDFFNTWLLTHIMIVDQQYSKYQKTLGTP